MSEYNFYQIDHSGVAEPDLTASGVARTDSSVAIRRPVDAKISEFGALNIGDRMDDYTRTVLDFESKDNLSDINVITEDKGMGANVAARGTTVEYNPYVTASGINSSVKRMRDDQAFRMGMSGYTGAQTVTGGVLTTVGGSANSIDQPGFDVMDTKSIVSGMVAGKNWPSEGWRSFGGKYDFTPYSGGGIH